LVEAGELGERVFRAERFEAQHLHGARRLSTALDVELADMVLLSADDGLLELDLGRAVYLDTETTGLAGGAGTTVFMVGMGSWKEAAQGLRPEFEVWQGFLRDPGAEAALLEEVAQRVRGSGGLVSFFGKSFDRHRLEDRMRMHGVAPPFEDVPHLDLYHPLRRLYGHVFRDGRLRTMEFELSGLEREDDLPGSLAPAAWYDYLRGRPHQLEGVFRHNLDDVLSLVTLAGHLGSVRRGVDSEGESLAGPPECRTRAIGRALLDARERPEGIAWMERYLDEAPDGRATREERWWLADALRLEGEVDRAVVVMEGLVGSGRDVLAVRALRGLSMIREHAVHDVPAAWECARAGLELVREIALAGGSSSLEADLVRRTQRLSAAAPTE
jgi:uncharacterized protein YprB with RNaseH-like and TPR domain